MTGDAEPSARRLLAYALPALPLAILSLPFYVLVPAYYAAGLALPIAAVGQTLMWVRVMDAVSDPIVGALADRFRPRFGRRRLWVALATPFVVIAAWGVFAPPASAGLWHLFGWGAALSIAWTAVQIPYGAWGAELSRSYAGRNRVTAYREALTVAGALLALTLPALLPRFGVEGDGAVLAAFAAIVAVALPLGTATAVLVVPEPVERSRETAGWREGLAGLAANLPFRRLLVAFLINGLANGLPATLFLFFVRFRLDAADAAGPLLVLYFLAGVAGVPGWLWLARRTSKHRAWCWGMMLACAAFSVAPWLGSGDVAAFAAVTLVTGLALGADVILPASMQADVIDVDTARSGQERTGVYLAFWALATKLALAGAVGVAFPILGAAGFDAALGSGNPPSSLATLAFLYAGLPVLLKLVAIGLVWRFPLDAQAHAQLRRAIEAARERATPP
ncbi:MFS transporter [Alsobacter sp. KACC 23698]|uniref:MFS transporter n=1 Tax=Alsobacter sp. KACC 23698 TaxID=3149229 RepID=A0AAU7J9E3_9HYPH